MSTEYSVLSCEDEFVHDNNTAPIGSFSPRRRRAASASRPRLFSARLGVVRFSDPGEAGAAPVCSHPDRDRPGDYQMGFADRLLREMDAIESHRGGWRRLGGGMVLPDASVGRARQSEGQMPDLLHAALEAEEGRSRR